MQVYEGTGVVPRAAWRAPAVDHHHIGVAMAEQRIGEGHAGGARADDQLIGVDGVHDIHP